MTRFAPAVAGAALCRCIAASTALCLLLACGGKGPKSEDSGPAFAKNVSESPIFGKGVLGLNRPTENQNGVGVRAVASGKTLAVTVQNLTATPLLVEPAMFRFVSGPHRLYALDPQRDSLSGFGAREVAPGQMELFYANIAGLGDDLTGRSLIFNCPPRGVLMRMVVEPVTDTYRAEIEEPEPDGPSRR